MKKIWAEIRRRKRSSLAILVSGLLASTFAVIQITGDLNSIFNPNDKDQVLASVETGSISDLINESRGLASECSYTGIWLRNASGAVVDISEPRWITENPQGDTEFKFRCLNMNLETEFSITNLALTNPGSVKISGTVLKGEASNLSISVVSQDKDQSWCGTNTFSFNLTKNADGYVHFEGSESMFPGDKTECRYAYPASFISTQQEANLQESTVFSRKVDALLVGATPSNCSYVGSVILSSSSLPDGEDKDFADYINANFLSNDSFAISSPGADSYVFDPSLKFKTQYFPEWIWVCKGTGVDYSEVHLGGYNWVDGLVAKPGINSMRAYFNPSTKSPVRAVATLEAFNQDIESCGVFKFDFSTETDVDGWQRFTDMVNAGSKFDSGSCRIFSLKTIKISN